jgi:3-hydroxyisobutyrate dehydrogenase
MSAKVAFIGLGVMGFPMAGHLKAKGYDVVVYNRTGAKAQDWAAKHGGKSAATPAAAAKDADFVMTMVGNDNDVLEVVGGKDGVLSGMKKGAILIDHTTASADVARKVYAMAREKGVDFIDAPVSGGQAGAENGKLSIMCGGSAAAMTVAEPLMQAYALRIVHIGDAGAGQTTKMVNQIALAAAVQGIAEALRFAQASGLDTDKVFEAVSGGAASSWQMVNRWETMSQDKFDFGFAVDWMRKDLGLTLDEAKRNGASLPVTALVDQFYADVQKMGGGRNDTSSLIRRLPR